MLDPRVQALLETAITSSCKLAIAVLFAERPTLSLTAAEIAERVYRDRWSVEHALADLVRAGVLEERDGRYACAAHGEVRQALRLLQECFADPLLRMELLQLLREIERYAPYQHDLPRRFWDTRAA